MPQGWCVATKRGRRTDFEHNVREFDAFVTQLRSESWHSFIATFNQL
jgi:hypothetical protein